METPSYQEKTETVKKGTGGRNPSCRLPLASLFRSCEMGMTREPLHSSWGGYRPSPHATVMMSVRFPLKLAHRPCARLCYFNERIPQSVYYFRRKTSKGKQAVTGRDQQEPCADPVWQKNLYFRRAGFIFRTSPDST